MSSHRLIIVKLHDYKVRTITVTKEHLSCNWSDLQKNALIKQTNSRLSFPDSNSACIPDVQKKIFIILMNSLK
jgi:hypothetical protein